MATPVRSTAPDSATELDDLRAMVAGLVAKELSLSELRSVEPAPSRQSGWPILAELGLLGIALPEQYGGGGAGLAELAVVCEELARELVPAPFFASICLAAEAIIAAGDDGACAALLPGIAAGERTATLASGRVHADRSGDGWTLTGHLSHVPDGADADLLLCEAETPDGATIFVVDGQTAAARRRLTTLDPTRSLADVGLAGTPARMIGAPGDAPRSLRLVRMRATALLAAEQAAIAERCVEITRQYLMNRRQFGRPIGAFQALKHRLADAAVAAELATSSAWYAIRQLDRGHADEVAVAVAAAKCGDAALQNAAEMIQLHGGIGYTWEHVAHLYLRRAKADQHLADTPSAHRDRLGAIVADTPAPNAAAEPAPPPQAGAVLAELDAWLAEHLTEEVRTDTGVPAPGRKYSRVREDWFRRLGAAGWATPTWPAAHGGRGLNREDGGVVVEELRRRGVDRPEEDFVGVWLAGPTILQWGTDDQRAEYLLPLALGEHRWCQLFSEPGAGSDLASLGTSAVATDGGWLVNGQKIWSSFADTADYGLLMARTDPTLPKHEGISYFLLDMRTPGVEVRPLRQMTGDAEFNEVFLTDVLVPDSARLGPLNAGWKVAISTLAQERNSLTGPPVVGPGVADRLIAEAVASGAWEDAAIRDRLTHVLVDERALQTASMRSSATPDRNPGAIDSIRKLVSADLHERVGRIRVDLAPAVTLGWPEDEPMPAGTRSFLEMKKYCIAGGTSEIQRNIIAERVLGLPRDVDPDRGRPFNQRSNR
ncbi:acyl-CoA dehydrogenase [Mycolicibacterium sp. S2-37]|uniref:acyl-CoA dehydrogenase n=1 Tax=Mycolicibacterium sp. S2-37 TaxID=2810297 RepID=UPI001A94C827|nr:acyl-CoA dehydrogenase [Mycolicibacterium sp. S2-37]MBO0676616.1 acyl-CoA dehydrogenase [Mycolicibacterium sp. S2-37]